MLFASSASNDCECTNTLAHSSQEGGALSAKRQQRLADAHYMSEGVSTLSALESKLARRQYLVNTKLSELHIN